MIESALHFHRTKNFHFGSFKVQMGFQVFFLKNDQIYRSDLSDLPSDKLGPDCQTI